MTRTGTRACTPRPAWAGTPSASQAIQHPAPSDPANPPSQYDSTLRITVVEDSAPVSGMTHADSASLSALREAMHRHFWPYLDVTLECRYSGDTVTSAEIVLLFPPSPSADILAAKEQYVKHTACGFIAGFMAGLDRLAGQGQGAGR